MRVKETDAISGMHMPSGENLWASPADDDEEEKEEEDMEKKALGLTSIPGEQQMDYQLEQPFHIKDPDNVGVIDVETVTDMPPMNNAKDSSPERKMEELLEDLIRHLESKGYSDKAKLIKSATIMQRSPEEVTLAYSQAVQAEMRAWQPVIKEVKYEAIDHNVPHFVTNIEKLRTDWLRQIMDPKVTVLEYVRGVKSAITQAMKDMGRADSRHNFQDGEMKSWETTPGRWDDLLRLYTQKASGLRDAAFAYKAVFGQNTQEAARPQQAAKSRGASGWEGYAGSGEDQKALSDAWQASPPEGYRADFSSFQKWYLKKKQELGRHFSPVEAMKMIGASTEPDRAAVGMTGDEKPQEGPQGVTEEVSGQVAIEPTRDNISESIRRLLRGMPLTAPGVDANVLESGKVKRMTKRYLRGIGSDRTIRSQEDQDKVIGLAASAITQVDLNGKSFEGAVAETLEGLEGNTARQAFDGVVWQFLQRAWAAYGSVRGKEVSDRREQRRLRRLDRQQDRQFNRAERRSRR